MILWPFEGYLKVSEDRQQWMTLFDKSWLLTDVLFCTSKTRTVILNWTRCRTGNQLPQNRRDVITAPRTSAQPRNLCVGWVQSQSNRSCRQCMQKDGQLRRLRRWQAYWRILDCRRRTCTFADGVDGEQRLAETARPCTRCTTEVPERCLEGRRTAQAVRWRAHHYRRFAVCVLTEIRRSTQGHVR